MSQYFCQTPTCVICISKAFYEQPRNCPVCLNPLETNDTISAEDFELINSLPYVIAYPLKQTLLEKHPWTKINLLKDTFLNYLKYLGLLSASEFFNSEVKDKGMVALFHENLMETAFGKWNHYIRECLSFLKKQNHSFFYPELAAYYELVETGSKSKKFKGEIEYQDANGDTQIIMQTSITSIGMLINFRNRYLGHGLTLDAEKSEKLWNEYFPIFRHLLEQLSFSKDYPMLKREHGETYLLHSPEIKTIASNNNKASTIWIENKMGQPFEILPFFIVPGEVSLKKEDKEQLLTYESYTGKTIKFFSPEGTEKQTSGKILDKLNLLLREKLKEDPYTPESFTKEEFLNRIAEENKLLLDALIAEKKIIPGVYQHREEMEIKLREWIGARANILFIVAEAGSGKTNLLAEIQKQYTDRELPSLLIRAGRMEKQTLKQQIAYLLNIDLSLGLAQYPSIAGSQAQPTFILIDGLNEANHAEEIWQEIIELSKLFEPGSLKVVVTNRANTKADLDRYPISENEQAFLYGENKENENGLSAYAFWLTALDMKEMKGLWENYIAKDKSRFKPLFSFEDIATFDRAIYNQINNPLILRLFLEIYNGKQLPKKKGVKHLNIWHDWFQKFSMEEQIFIKYLVDEIWVKGENELLLDDLLKHEKLKAFFTSDIINEPYLRLHYQGWISRYVKDLNAYVGFTIEGALCYLLGLKLSNQLPEVSIDFIQTILENGNKLQKGAIESFLCEQALNKNLDLVANLIDTGNDAIDLSITPLLYYLKNVGVYETIEKVFENPTENDWIVLKKLDGQLEKLQLYILRKEFLTSLMPLNEYKTKEAVAICLRAAATLDKEVALHYLSQLDTHASLIREDAELLFQLGQCESKFGNYEKALEYHEKSLAIYLKTLSTKDIELVHIYHSIAVIYCEQYEFYKARELMENALNIQIEKRGKDYYLIPTSLKIIGNTWYGVGQDEKAKEYYEKSLAVELKTIGIWHRDSAQTLALIGNICNYDIAIGYYEKALNILQKTVGTQHSDIGVIFFSLGYIKQSENEYIKALDFYKNCLNIYIQSYGIYHPDVVEVFEKIAECNMSLLIYLDAIENYNKIITIADYSKELNSNINRGEIFNQIGICYESISDKKNALINFIQSAEERHDCLWEEQESILESVENAKRIAKEIGKEKELPKWFKNNLNN